MYNYCQKRRAAFTLIEMMVVMIILVILMTILFPVVFRSRARAQRRQAQAEANALVLAIKSYQNIFGEYPAQRGTNDMFYFTNNFKVVRPLMGHNSRQRSFINIQTNSLCANTNYLDPAGVPYVIFIDQDGSSRMTALTNTYTWLNPRTSVEQDYKLKSLEIRVSVGAGAFMNKTNALEVNSWSDL
ncbi:MAG: type II secretion system protein [Kiritimatiellia bacterium]|nr:type II secretion system GspH family protein [Lentisphaerota bacterium]